MVFKLPLSLPFTAPSLSFFDCSDSEFGLFLPANGHFLTIKTWAAADSGPPGSRRAASGQLSEHEMKMLEYSANELVGDVRWHFATESEVDRQPKTMAGAVRILKTKSKRTSGIHRRKSKSDKFGRNGIVCPIGTDKSGQKSPRGADKTAANLRV